MKKVIKDFVKSLGGSAHYSGNERTMYITADNTEEIMDKIIEKFGYNLPFKISESAAR